MKRRKSTRNLHNSSTRRKNNTLVLIDRISALPDSILGLILSYLPTKNAVATTVLSKRWKFVWMTVHNLDFCHNDDWRNQVPEEEEDMKFVRFVNRVLLLHDGGLLNKFRLVWKPRFIPSQVTSWISIAITRNVNELSLCVEDVEEHWGKPLELPISLFSCDSLQSLELSGSISVSAANVVCLPRLESLKLVSVYFQSEQTFQKLICGCPMLNYLLLDMDLDERPYFYPPTDDFKYIISSTSLRRLELCAVNTIYFYYWSLELEASSLEYLKLVGVIPEVFVQGSLSSLVEADVRISLCENKDTVDVFDSLVEAVRAFGCARALTLSSDVMLAISNATISLSTKFSRLTKLVAGAQYGNCSSLQDFIQSLDTLEDLTVYEDRINIEGYDHNHSNWNAHVEVPRCLSNSLKVVAFEGYHGYDDEREMIGYMLKHGSVLEVMHVTCSEYSQKDKHFQLVKEICLFPRKSPACKVEFIG